MKDEDFVKCGFDPATIAPNVRRACVRIRVGVSDFYVPLGKVESFILMALSSDNDIYIHCDDNLQFRLSYGDKDL